jgi:hypothetical protein
MAPLKFVYDNDHDPATYLYVRLVLGSSEHAVEFGIGPLRHRCRMALVLDPGENSANGRHPQGDKDER